MGKKRKPELKALKKRLKIERRFAEDNEKFVCMGLVEQLRSVREEMEEDPTLAFITVCQSGQYCTESDEQLAEFGQDESSPYNPRTGLPKCQWCRIVGPGEEAKSDEILREMVRCRTTGRH